MNKCLECGSEEATIEGLCFACWMLVGDEDIPKPTEDEFLKEPNENLHGFHTPRGDWPDR